MSFGSLKYTGYIVSFFKNLCTSFLSKVILVLNKALYHKDILGNGGIVPCIL